jgi:neutral ceramidase
MNTTCCHARCKRILACLALFIGGPFADADDPEWKVGLAQTKITPIQPMLMSGYAGRTKPFESVAAELYVKAMVLRDSTGRRGVMVTSDLLGFPAAVAEPICERIQKKTGLKREEILLNSSHTHAGPKVGLRVKEDKSDDLRTVEYTRELQDKVVDVVVEAAQRLEPARLSWGSGVIHFAMNRREFTPTGVILGVNPRGLADRSVPVLRIDAADGTPRAILFGAAVHGTTLGQDNLQICGDYAGFAQSHVEEKFPKVQAMFMLGCAGDANPYPRGTMDQARHHGKTLGEEVCRVVATKLRPVKGPLQIAFGMADVPLQSSFPREGLEKLVSDKRNAKSFAAKQMLDRLNRGDKLPTRYPCPLAVWQFGDSLTMVGLSGEVVVDYVTILERALGPNQLWVAAYCNDVFGYLPSARVLNEGGYETRGLYSGGAGWFAPEAEQVVVRKVRELARTAGRALPGQRGQAATKVREVIAHRGSSIDRPENTLASYRRAIEVGATATECDVRTTKDGVLVSLHDADVNRTSNGKGLIGDKTLAELKRLDFGSWFDPRFRNEPIPTLQEILELCHGKIDVMLDLKESGQPYAEKVAALVRKYGQPKRTILGVRSAEQARQFRKLLPQSRQIGLIPTPQDIPAFAEAGVETIRLWPKWLTDQSLVEQIRKHQKQLHLGAGKGTKDEVLPLLPYEPESLSSDDPGGLIQTLAQIAGRKIE